MVSGVSYIEHFMENDVAEMVQRIPTFLGFVLVLLNTI